MSKNFKFFFLHKQYLVQFSTMVHFQLLKNILTFLTTVMLAAASYLPLNRLNDLFK